MLRAIAPRAVDVFGPNEELEVQARAMEQADKDAKKKRRGRKRAAVVDEGLDVEDQGDENQGDRGNVTEGQPRKRARVKKVKEKGKENGNTIEQPVAKAAKPKGRGSKSGAQNRRIQGTSDDEIAQLGDKAVKGSQITPATGAWSDADRLTVINYICSEKVWTDFKINQAKECLFVSIFIPIVRERTDTYLFKDSTESSWWQTRQRAGTQLLEPRMETV